LPRRKQQGINYRTASLMRCNTTKYDPERFNPFGQILRRLRPSLFLVVWLHELLHTQKPQRDGFVVSPCISSQLQAVVFDEKVDGVLKDVCLDIEQRYQIKSLGIGTDADHVHFLVQSVPNYTVTKIVTTIPDQEFDFTSGS